MQVDIEKIIPVTEARDRFNKIIDDVEDSDELYVFTKNGKPAAIIVGVHHLEKLTGQSHQEIVAKMEEKEKNETIENPAPPLVDSEPKPGQAEEPDAPPSSPTPSPQPTPNTSNPTDPTSSIPEGKTVGDMPQDPQPAADPFSSPPPAPLNPDTSTSDNPSDSNPESTTAS